MTAAVRLSEVLRDFSRLLLAELPLSEVVGQMLAHLVGILPATAAGITVFTAGDVPRTIAASSVDAEQLEQLQTDFNEGPCVLACATGTPVLIPDLTHESRFPRFCRHAQQYGLAAVFAFPLRDGDSSFGALDLYCEHPERFSTNDVATAQDFADIAAMYLITAQTRARMRQEAEQLRSFALHDSLTGLPNRRLLEQLLEHAGRGAQRDQTAVAVLFFDIDNFKQVNDTYGHPGGDTLLRAVANRVHAAVRPGDAVARFAGDEFVVLCEGLAGVTSAEHIAARVQAAFDLPFSLGEASTLASCSLGIAVSAPGGAGYDRLLEKADTAMYQAKRRGGHCSQVFSGVPPEAHFSRQPHDL